MSHPWTHKSVVVSSLSMLLLGIACGGCGETAGSSPTADGSARDAASGGPSAAEPSLPGDSAVDVRADARVVADGAPPEASAPPVVDRGYTPDDDPQLLNPERGIYYWDPQAADPHSLIAGWLYLGASCNQELTWNGHKKAGTSAVLNAFADALVTHRAAGRKVIFRPRYDTPQSDAVGPCGVFQADSNARQLRHVDAIAAMLGDFRDVVAFVEMGYLGRWGEWNWSGYGPTNAPMLADPAQRRALVDYVLRAYDARGLTRFVGLRRPVFAKEVTDTQPTSGARTGLYDDCFMTDSTDMGTYSNMDGQNSSNFATSSDARAWAEARTLDAPFGGETCPFDTARWKSCTNMTGPASEPQSLHMTYLHAGYAPDAKSTWESGGCYADIKRRLGYRFELDSVQYPQSAQPGEEVTVSVRVRNTGWSRMHNSRQALIVLRSATKAYVVGPVAAGYESLASLGASSGDVREWIPEKTSELVRTFAAPPPGTYRLHLYLPDPVRPDVIEYSVRVASRRAGTRLWEGVHGENDLGVDVVVR